MSPIVGGVYPVGRHDRAVALDGVPWPPGGPAHARVVSDDGTTRLLYYVADAWGAPDSERPERRVAVCTFTAVRGVYFGAPNDEALGNHPLYERGLDFYGVFRVEASSWAAALERLAHRKDAGDRARRELSHWVVTMEDNTFECVARDLDVEVRPQGIAEVLADILGASPLGYKQEREVSIGCRLRDCRSRLAPDVPLAPQTSTKLRDWLVVNWPVSQHIAWLARDQFNHIYSVRREHLKRLGMDVTGLDAALADPGSTEIGVFTTAVAGQQFAFFITRAEVLGNVELPAR